MAFIDIFNYKKYFKKASDSNVARIGHVNAAYAASQPKFTVDSVTQITDLNQPVTINSTAGSITTSNPIPTAGASFTVNNSAVTSSSIIIVSVKVADNDKGKDIVSSVANVSNGSFTVAANLAAAGATSSVVTINFLVINP